MSCATRIELADAVAGELACFLDHALDRLGHVLAAHVGNRAEGAKPVAPFGDLEVGEVPRRDAQPGAIVLGLHGRGSKKRALFAQAAQKAIGNLGDLFAAEDADHLVNLGKLLQQHVLLPFRQAAGDDHAAHAAVALALEHFLDDRTGFLPGRVDEPAGVHDHQVGVLPLRHQREPILRQEPEHPLGIDQVLGAAQADEGQGPFYLIFDHSSMYDS